MKHALTFALVLGGITFARVELADAGSCGGGGSSSGGSSGGGGSSSGDSGSSSDYSSSSDDYDYSSSSSSSTTYDLKPACVETTDIHGYRECQGYGQWHKPQKIASMFFEVGAVVRQFQTPFGTRTATVEHLGEQFAYRVVDGGGGGSSADVPLDAAGALQLRTGFRLRHGLYLGAEAELGGLTSSSASAEMTTTEGERGRPSISESGVAMLGGALVLGIGGRLGSIDLAAEVAGGVRMLSYTYDSKYGACEITTSVTATSGMAEARARASLWTSPWVSIGATAGKSLVDEGWMGGVYINANTRAFGGR